MPDIKKPVWPDSVSPTIPTIGRMHLGVLAQIAGRGERPVHSPLKPGEATQLVMELGRRRGQSDHRAADDHNDK